MDEENPLTISSSQESLPLSQESFNLLWDEIQRSGLSILTDDVNTENFASGSGHQISNIPVKTEVVDNCDVNNSTDQLQSIPLVNEHLTEINHVPTALLETIPVQTQISPAGTNISSIQHAPSSLPASQTWPGDFDFTVSFDPQMKKTKGVAWMYSKIKDKLYVGKDAPCPVNFSANSILPENTFIRVMALYTSPEQASEVVKRCINHSMEESDNGIEEAEHLIRCESSQAIYQMDAITGRHSVVVPFENPQAGQQFSTYIYKFACFGSCAGGPNRRPLMLIFTLEFGNQIIGRKKLDVKICACPGRDCKTDEAQFAELENTQRVAVKRKEPEQIKNLSDYFGFAESVYFPPVKKSKLIPTRDGQFIVSAGSRDCYEFLMNMKRFYDMCQSIAGITPDVMKALQHFLKKKNKEE